jgi:predicted dienelactone hydrolase
MNQRLQQLLASAALLGLSALAQAGVGLIELPGIDGDRQVTVFYPSDSPQTDTVRGPFHLQLAVGGQPRPGNRRLVVISHGSGGSAWVHADLARQLVDAGFVVAAPEHRGDNWEEMRTPGPGSWKLRPGEVSRAIDAVAKDSRLAPLVALDRVGMFGMSAGGHAALTLAGGRWSPSRLLSHCQQHLEDDFATCTGGVTELNGGALDGLKKFVAGPIIRFKLNDDNWHGQTDPRIQAVVAEVPFAVDFDLQTLAAPKVALGLVRAGQDLWLTPRYHIDQVLHACKTCTVIADLAQAGHGSLLGPRPEEKYLPSSIARLLRDPPGFDPAQVAPANARIVEFLRAHLTP